MKSNSFFYLIAASLAILAAVPARFAYGLLCFLLLNFLLVAGIFAGAAVSKFGFDKFRQPVVLAVLVILTIFFRQMLFLFSPASALTLSFSLYLVCFSSVLVGAVLANEAESPAKLLLVSYKKILPLTVFALLFFLFRDFISFGTLSLPVPAGIYEFRLISGFQGIPFFASIPGAFILLSFVLVIQYLAAGGAKKVS